MLGSQIEGGEHDSGSGAPPHTEERPRGPHRTPQGRSRGRGSPTAPARPPPGAETTPPGPRGRGSPKWKQTSVLQKAFRSQISPLIATQHRVPESQRWFLMKTRCSRPSTRCPGPMSFAFVSSPCTRTLRLSPVACRGVRAIRRGWISRDGVQHPVPSSLCSRPP